MLTVNVNDQALLAQVAGVDKVGVDAMVSDYATRQAAAYGAIAVLTAVVAGWLASLPFRGV